MKKVRSTISLSKEDLVILLILPTVVTAYLLLSPDYTFLQVILASITGFLQSLPTWLVPIVAPGALFMFFWGLPVLISRIFQPKYGNLLFSSISLTFAILLVNFMKFYISTLG